MTLKPPPDSVQDAIPTRTSDRAIAADLWQRAAATGKAGHAYPSGLRVAVYVNNGTRSVKYGRLDRYPSLLECTFLNKTFGAPEHAEFKAYQTEKYLVKDFTWNEPSNCQEDTAK
jgi:hypothetical protein